jgi:CheY-like chemotaxis protein
MARILVIDDDQGVRDLLGAWLTMDGHACLMAANGHFGVELLRATPMDLVITDLVMKYGGVMTIRVIRWEFPRVGIIAITGHGQALLEQARAAGADRLIAKPLDAAVLRTTVKELLAAGRPTADGGGQKTEDRGQDKGQGTEG